MKPRSLHGMPHPLSRHAALHGAVVAICMIAVANSESTALGALATGGVTSTSNSPFAYGPYVVRPNVSYQYVYIDRVLVSAGRRRPLEQHTVSAGVQLERNSRWNADYLARQNFYSRAGFSDSLDHAANFTAALNLSDWAIGVTQGYSVNSSPLIETGRQTTLETSATTIEVSHPFTSKLSGSASVSQSLRFVEASPDSYNWSMAESLGYQISSRTSISGGVVVSYNIAEKSTDTIAVGPQAILAWQPGDKLTLNAQLGLESRYILSSRGGGLTSTVFSVAGKYQPFQATTLRLEATRSVAPSLLQGLTGRLTNISVGADQRFLQRFFVSVNYSYGLADYLSTLEVFSKARRDYNETADVSIRTTVRQRLTFAVTYSETYNSSNAAGFDLSSHRIVAQVGFSY
jgi:hypothetical protein